MHSLQYKRSTSALKEVHRKLKVYSHQIQCRAQCCTSLISVSPGTLDLGECIVGQLRSDTFTVKNESDMTALVLPFVSSKSLEILEKELTIPPRGSKVCHVEYVARTVNDFYVNTITVMNVFNSHCNLNVDVRASNIDINGIVELSTLYQLHTRNDKMQTQIYFDKCLSQVPNMRSFAIRNMSSEFLQFELTTSSDSTVQIFKLSQDRNDVKLKKDLDIAGMKWGSSGVDSSSRSLTSANRPRKKSVDDAALRLPSYRNDTSVNGIEAGRDANSKPSGSAPEQAAPYSYSDSLSDNASRGVEFVHDMSASSFPFCFLDRHADSSVANITNSVTVHNESKSESCSDNAIADGISLIYSCYEDYRKVSVYVYYYYFMNTPLPPSPY